MTQGAQGFPCGSAGKESVGNVRPGFDPWVGKIPWRKERLPTPVFWPREFHGLYSPWGCKESDTTEQLSLSLNYAFYMVIFVTLENKSEKTEKFRLLFYYEQL